MKALLILYTFTLFLGSMLSLHLAQEGWLFLILYSIAAYHLYRVNFTKSFFLTFQETPQKNEQVKVRLGPTEIDIRNENDRAEDKFLDLFDWKKSYVRKFLSWSLFAGSVFLLFYQLRLEINEATVMPLISCLFLMRAISVGHLLVPLSINLIIVLFAMKDFSTTEMSLFFVYGVLVVTILSLIYPSEERLGSKLRDWLKGRWMEVGSSAAIILLTFSAGIYLFQDLDFKKNLPEIKKEEVQEQLKKSDHLQSSLDNMMNKGILQNPELRNKVKGHCEKLKNMVNSENISPEIFQKTLAEGLKLEQEFSENLTSSSTPELTPELLESMIKDVSSRERKDVSEETYLKMEQFLKKAQNFNGAGGSELISEYRQLKFGKGGFYREETEFEHESGLDNSMAFLDQLKKSETKKKEIRENLEKNIQDLKLNPDESLLSVNKALKDELDVIDSLSKDDREKIQSQLRKSSELQQDLVTRATDPKLQETFQALEKERDQLSRMITPHMNAAAKSELAGKMEEHHKKMNVAGRKVKDEIKKKLKVSERKTTESELQNTDWLGKIKKIVTLSIVAGLIFWFVRLFGKKGVKHVRGIPDKVKEELAEELKSIRKMNLSPREEVIHTYNVFHNGLQTLIFTNETPPSCIVYEGIKVAEPELEGATFTVTETFARTFYGEKDVTHPELQSFRRDVRKIFSFFDISW